MAEYDPNYVDEKNFYLLGVKVALVNDANEVLMLKRSDKTPRPGGWDLPGGSVDADESPENAALRETLEETGIVIDAAKVVLSAHIPGAPDPLVILGFGARVPGRSVPVEISWEHDESVWVPLESIDSIELPEGYKHIVRLYAEEIGVSL